MAWRRRIQGLLFLVVVAGLVGLTIAVYNKSLPWQGSDTVYLTAARIGNELNVPSDVKYDGVLVGRVSSVSSNGENATLTLQINPSAMAEIPANVEAQILPKTLFGEKYVQLVQPAQPATQSIAVNATIPQDRSKTSLELQTVFDNLVPLLRALNPAQLSVTLTNLADTLQGRGQELGQNLALMNQYFKTFNTDLPNLNHDISALATLAGNYAQASPDLLATLRNFSQTAQTFVAKQASYATFLANSQGLTTTASRVIGGNADRLIRLNAISRPVTTEYGRDAIVFECMANGLAIYDRQRLEGTFGPASADPQGTYNTAPRGVPGLHITLIPVGDRGTYTSKPKREELTKLPNYGKAHGQRKSDLLCRGLPYGNHPLRPQFDRYPKYPGAPRGNYNLGGFAASSAPSPAASKQSTRKASGHAAASPASQVVPGTGGDGSSQEQLGISGMLASFGDPRSNSELGLEDLLLGPMLRDMTVVPSKDVRR
jgi:virulence factor Mce-like protein